MSKIRRGGHSAEGETLSAGRVEYLEAARARVRTRRIRRTVIIVAVLTILVLFATGAVGSSIARAKDLVDTAVIALAPAAGWPQQTGITDPDAVAQMSGSFVEMGGDSCVVYSLGGTRLNSIQSGYARPAIAAGKTRFVLYNRSGNELRVESRTQNLYTKTMDSTISLCAVADAGQVAVVTDSTDSVAKLTVYNSSMQQQLVWNLTSEQGTPLRMAFAPDSRRLAVAAVSAVGGQLTTNLYVLPLSQGDPVCLGSENSVPQWMGWMSNGFLLVLYENRAVLYNTSGGSAGERASYDFGGGTLVSVSNTSNGAALLLSNGQTSTAVLLDGELTVGTAAACSRPARSSGQRTTASTCSPTAQWSASTVWASSSGANRFRPGPGRWSRAGRSWCSPATRCRWSHRRSRQLPADSDFWVRRSCVNSTLAGKVIKITGKTRYVQESVISF